MSLETGSRRGVSVDITQILVQGGPTLAPGDAGHFEAFDLVYRSLCALMFNYVPTSGHPGGSISSGDSTCTMATSWPRCCNNFTVD